jgi:hypothetical protein
VNQDERDFVAALQQVVRECRAIGYNPTGFLGMISSRGPFESVRALLRTHRPSDGFMTLWEKHRLDLTVEAVVLRPEWSRFFSAEELSVARSRLREVGFGVGAADATTEGVQGIESAPGGKVRDARREASPMPASRLSPGANGDSVAIVVPPIEDAEKHLERVRSIERLPERDHEDFVKELLVALGHDPASIQFQLGRIDLRVRRADGSISAVIEVKRWLHRSRCGTRRSDRGWITLPERALRL